jgi:hypothetical protein
MFTPLGTPAVTPMDNNFPIEYIIPGEYFTPISSPAIHAQNSGHVEATGYGHFPISDQSGTTSPVNVNFDLSAKGENSPAIKKQKRKSPAGAPKPHPRTVRSSPAMKPQRKKQSASTVIPAKEVIEIMSGGGSRPSTAQSLALPPSQFSSESGSISPEPMSDSMPPPATPITGSAGRSPYLSGRITSQPALSQAMGSPATPRSLMKIPEPSDQNDPSGLDAMQDISLPEAALGTKPFLSSLDTQMVDVGSTPVLSAQNGSVSASVMSTPSILPSPVTSTPKTVATKSKGDFKAPLRSKKRNSSSHQSPALRPRISPSIKPLLPEGCELSFLFYFIFYS